MRNTTDKKRRYALKSAAVVVAGAAGLPTEWRKPVINAIVLPAHSFCYWNGICLTVPFNEVFRSYVSFESLPP